MQYTLRRLAQAPFASYTVRMRSGLRPFCFAAALLLFPAAVLASEGVQFANHSVFLSQPSAPAGSDILIYASLVNTATSSFTGTAIFKDGSAELGRVGVSLSAGEARVVSISWAPTAGSHQISASLADASGNPVSARSGETRASADFKIETPPPAPPALADDALAGSGGSGAGASSTLAAAVIPATALKSYLLETLPPAASSTVETVVSAIDRARGSAVDAIDTQIARARNFQKNHPAASGQIAALASSTEGVGANTITANSAISTAKGMLASAYLGVLSAFRYALESPTLSYLAFIALVILIPFSLIRVSRRSN